MTDKRSTDKTALSRDDIFSILSNQRRRHVLHYLKRRGEAVPIGDLAEQLAAWENGVSSEEITYKQRKRVYTSLHQTHLPKLDDYGVVEYDRNRGVAILTDGVDELDVYLDAVEEDGTPWSDYYLALAGVGLLLVVGAWLDVAPFTALPDIVYGGVLALLLAVTATIHAVGSRRRLHGATDTTAEAPADVPPPSVDCPQHTDAP